MRREKEKILTQIRTRTKPVEAPINEKKSYGNLLQNLEIEETKYIEDLITDEDGNSWLWLLVSFTF
jgi:hypothetical protein